MEEDEKQRFHKKIGKRRYHDITYEYPAFFFMNRWMYICGFQISTDNNKGARIISQIREGKYRNGSYFYPVYKAKDNIAPKHMVLRRL